MLGVVLLFGGGIFAATQVQQDLLPDISIPAVIVITPYPGASPQVVDTQVTVPVANALEGLSGVNTVQSTSSQGVSLVVVLFKDGIDLKSAEQDVNRAVAGARPFLPPTVPASTVQTFSTNSIPILTYAVSANESLGDLAGQLRAQALPKLKGLAGVSSVVVTGAPTDEVDVTLDPLKLAKNGVGPGQVASALQQATIVQSIGSLKNGNATIPLQVTGSLTSLDQITGLVVAPPNKTSKKPVTVGDVATVQLVSVAADTITRTDLKPTIGLQVTKGPSANTVVVANEVKDALPGIEGAIGNGIHIESIADQATPITQAIGDILREGLLGAVFAVLVIFAFLRSGRATIVAAVSIPLSLLVALIVLWQQGITLNILTLGGMMVAIGRVVDDSIVVLENISRHVAEGERPLVAAYTGAREITTAVASSTLATVAVFLPIVFLTGIAGSFFRPFALTVVVALLASLVVAVTVVPLLAGRLLPARNVQGADRRLKYNWMQRVYVPTIRWATLDGTHSAAARQPARSVVQPAVPDRDHDARELDPRRHRRPDAAGRGPPAGHPWGDRVPGHGGRDQRSLCAAGHGARRPHAGADPRPRRQRRVQHGARRREASVAGLHRTGEGRGGPGAEQLELEQQPDAGRRQGQRPLFASGRERRGARSAVTRQRRR